MDQKLVMAFYPKRLNLDLLCPSLLTVKTLLVLTASDCSWISNINNSGCKTWKKNLWEQSMFFYVYIQNFTWYSRRNAFDVNAKKRLDIPEDFFHIYYPKMLMSESRLVSAESGWDSNHYYVNFWQNLAKCF